MCSSSWTGFKGNYFICEMSKICLHSASDVFIEYLQISFLVGENTVELLQHLPEAQLVTVY